MHALLDPTAGISGGLNRLGAPIWHPRALLAALGLAFDTPKQYNMSFKKGGLYTKSGLRITLAKQFVCPRVQCIYYTNLFASMTVWAKGMIDLRALHPRVEFVVSCECCIYRRRRRRQDEVSC